MFDHASAVGGGGGGERNFNLDGVTQGQMSSLIDVLLDQAAAAVEPVSKTAGRPLPAAPER